MDLSDLRKQYSQGDLRKRDLTEEPIAQFKAWFLEAQEAKIIEPSAMTLVTASSDGVPSARTILLKSFSTKGFVFFTNKLSRKGKELKDNPNASALFLWKELERQVIIEGEVQQVTEEESEVYFSRRPRANQLAAWASMQDQVIENREFLEERMVSFEVEFRNQDVPTPPYWGGYRLSPRRVEFWQGGVDRLHDRFQYVAEGDSWKIDRLSP